MGFWLGKKKLGGLGLDSLLSFMSEWEIEHGRRVDFTMIADITS
jgi:hypothetical protein